MSFTREYINKVPSSETLYMICDNLNAKRNTDSVATILTLTNLIKAGCEVEVCVSRGRMLTAKVYMLLEYAYHSKYLVCFSSSDEVCDQDVVHRLDTSGCNAIVSQVRVPGAVDLGNDHYTYASYEDYCEIDSNSTKIVESCWDAITLDKYVCVSRGVKVGFFMVVPTVVTLDESHGHTHTPVLTCILSCIADKAMGVGRFLLAIAREVYDVNYVRALHKEELYPLRECDVNINVKGTIDMDAYFYTCK